VNTCGSLDCHRCCGETVPFVGSAVTPLPAAASLFWIGVSAHSAAQE
jgi:hypothetical protein